MVAQRTDQHAGLNCETADNGEKALERMMSGQLDLVLMDCQMPVRMATPPLRNGVSMS